MGHLQGPVQVSHCSDMNHVNSSSECLGPTWLYRAPWEHQYDSSPFNSLQYEIEEEAKKEMGMRKFLLLLDPREEEETFFMMFDRV